MLLLWLGTFDKSKDQYGLGNMNQPLKFMLKGFSPQALKWIFIFVATCCFIAVLPLPIGYYTFLRFTTTVGALLSISFIYQDHNKILKSVFFIITIFFNPLIPIYLQKKGVWIPLDILTGSAFLYLAFLKKTTKLSQQPDSGSTSGDMKKTLVRDRIITNKEIN